MSEGRECACDDAADPPQRTELDWAWREWGDGGWVVVGADEVKGLGGCGVVDKETGKRAETSEEATPARTAHVDRAGVSLLEGGHGAAGALEEEEEEAGRWRWREEPALLTLA